MRYRFDPDRWIDATLLWLSIFGLVTGIILLTLFVAGVR